MGHRFPRARARPSARHHLPPNRRRPCSRLAGRSLEPRRLQLHSHRRTRPPPPTRRTHRRHPLFRRRSHRHLWRHRHRSRRPRHRPSCCRRNPHRPPPPHPPARPHHLTARRNANGARLCPKDQSQQRPPTQRARGEFGYFGEPSRSVRELAPNAFGVVSCFHAIFGNYPPHENIFLPANIGEYPFHPFSTL